MDFLGLCNSLHEKTGESGADLTTVISQTGYYREVVNYIANAWLDIQTKHPSWRFLRREALPPTIALNPLVDADAWVLANLNTNIDEYHKNTFSVYDPAIGSSDESRLSYVAWERWKLIFGLDYDNSNPGRPIHITINPYTDQLVLGPTPDKAYIIAFQFAQQPVMLTADTDTPRIIAGLHEIIVWQALERYGMQEESNANTERGRRYYRRYLHRLQRRELPEIAIGGPLV